MSPRRCSGSARPAQRGKRAEQVAAPRDPDGAGELDAGRVDDERRRGAADAQEPHQLGPDGDADVASEHPGVTVREVDVAVRPEFVRLLGIRRTPTSLVVDPSGVELARTVGVPRRSDLLGTLAPLRRTG